MSHIVKVQTQVRDAIAVAAACERLKLPAPELKTVKLFSSEATGLAVQLPDWRYARRDLALPKVEAVWRSATEIEPLLPIDLVWDRFRPQQGTGDVVF